jgi:chaperonin cofactor prefoldin
MIKIISDIKALEHAGRDKNELARAEQHYQIQQTIEKKKKEITKAMAALKERNSALVELSELENKRIMLRKSLDEASAKTPTESDAASQKRAELLIDQIAALKNERPTLDQQLAELKAELERRKIKPDSKPQPVRINPSGSGISANTEMVFIECNANGIVILDKSGSKKPVSADTITTDGTLAATFKKLKANPTHMVLFLIRSDGNATYAKAGGYAENQFNLRIGKLPVPTQGEIDLSLFINK